MGISPWFNLRLLKKKEQSGQSKAQLWTASDRTMQEWENIKGQADKGNAEEKDNDTYR